MQFTKAQRKRVYLLWKDVFSTYENSQLRKQKPIRAYLQRNYPYSLRSDPNLVGILQSLLKDDIFRSLWDAEREFPELFTPSVKQPQKTALGSQAVGSSAQTPFDMNESSSALLRSLKELYSCGEYSDLTITCGGKDHRVHRSIVCPRSEFFAAACRHDFKEARESQINLPDDDPQVVGLMIYYLYHLDYEPSSLLERLKDDREEKKEADDNLAPSNQPHNTYANYEPIIHATMYALAEKYLINDLKALAVRKFKKAAEEHGASDNFLEVAQLVYESTIETDRGLRDIVVEIFYKHRKLLDAKEVQVFLQGNSSLTYDLLMHLHQQKSWY